MMGLSWKGRDAGGVGCSGDGWAVFTQKVAFGLLGLQRGWYFLAFYLFIYLCSCVASSMLLALVSLVSGVRAPLWLR